MSTLENTFSLSEKPVEAEAFREAMRRIASPVHAVTTAGPGGRAGFTCTAFASVSDDPPTVLVCLNRSSRAATAFRENGVFAVNVLTAADRAVADIFSGLDKRPLDRRFEPGSWLQGESGAPLLQSALASFDCTVLEVKDVASHQIMIGRVVGIRLGPEQEPLFYHHRHYRSFSAG